MNAFKILLAAAAINAGTLLHAQAGPTQGGATMYVYLMGKQDATHIILSEVYETSTQVTHEELVALFQQSHPEVPAPHGLEGASFKTRGEAKAARAGMQRDLEDKGVNVVVFEAKH